MTSAPVAHEVIDALVAAGVRHIVGCPGSRNAELLRRSHAHDAAGHVELHMRLDERTAGFTALGLAKATGEPAAVVVTSGTAVGNLLPAVMEAHHARVPLIVVSADRPASFRDTGANQTTVQPGLFGVFAREITQGELLDVGPGPAHLNVELAEPLLASTVDVVPVPRALRPTPSEGKIERLAYRPHTVVIVGDAPVDVGRSATADAERWRLPCLAEPSSNARRGGAISTYRALLETELGAAVERVIVVGRPTLSRPQRALLTDPGREVIVVGDPVAFHPGAKAYAALDVEPDPTSWREAWQDADAQLRQAVPVDGLAGLAARVLARMGTEDNLVWGSSQLIRDADVAPISDFPPVTYANRGLAGIDGLIATASGIALGSGRATTLVLGDVSALHDLSSLLIPTGERTPNLRVIVGNDDGGAIFSTLEQGGPDFDDGFERLFAVPHGQRLTSIAQAMGLRATSVETLDELDAILSCPAHGVELVEVAGARADRRRQSAQLCAAAAQLRLRGSE